jgi:hypothetical protein
VRAKTQLTNVSDKKTNIVKFSKETIDQRKRSEGREVTSAAPDLLLPQKNNDKAAPVFGRSTRREMETGRFVALDFAKEFI